MDFSGSVLQSKEQMKPLQLPREVHSRTRRVLNLKRFHCWTCLLQTSAPQPKWNGIN